MFHLQRLFPNVKVTSKLRWRGKKTPVWSLHLHQAMAEPCPQASEWYFPDSATETKEKRNLVNKIGAAAIETGNFFTPTPGIHPEVLNWINMHNIILLHKLHRLGWFCHTLSLHVNATRTCTRAFLVHLCSRFFFASQVGWTRNTVLCSKFPLKCLLWWRKSNATL